MSVRGVPGELKHALVGGRKEKDHKEGGSIFGQMRLGDPDGFLFRTIFDNVEPQLNIIYSNEEDFRGRSSSVGSGSSVGDHDVSPIVARAHPIFTSTSRSHTANLPPLSSGRVSPAFGERPRSGSLGKASKKIRRSITDFGKFPKKVGGARMHSFDLDKSVELDAPLSPNHLSPVLQTRKRRNSNPLEVEGHSGSHDEDIPHLALSLDTTLDSSPKSSSASPYSSLRVLADDLSTSEHSLSPENRRPRRQRSDVAVSNDSSPRSVGESIPIRTRPRRRSITSVEESSPPVVEPVFSLPERRHKKLQRTSTVQSLGSEDLPDPPHDTFLDVSVVVPKSGAPQSKESPKAPIFTLFDDARPSEATLQRSSEMKRWVEEYYWELLSYHRQRDDRAKKLAKKIAKETNEFSQRALLRVASAEESAILRSRRLCGRMDDFEFLKRLGKGAFGEVYLCRHKKSAELLALKRIHKVNAQDKIPGSVAAVLAERDVLRAATTDGDGGTELDTKWLTRLLYAFQDSVYIFFGMEFVPGGDFATFLQNMGELEEDQAKLFAAEMFKAVDTLHHLGYIHRDLKPDNFLIDAGGHLKLADFGLSKKGVAKTVAEPFLGQMPLIPTVGLFETTLSQERATGQARSRKEARKMGRKHGKKSRRRVYSMVGSPDYMAVEILRNVGYSFSADWWSLGCILFEMLCGFPPFTADTPHEVFANIMNYHSTLENPLYLDEDGQEQGLISDDAWAFIEAVITEPERRLGADGITSISRHYYFAGLDFGLLRQEVPVFVPRLEADDDTSYFDDAVPVPADLFVAADDAVEIPSFLEKVKTLDSKLHTVVSQEVLQGPGDRSSFDLGTLTARQPGSERARRLSVADADEAELHARPRKRDRIRKAFLRASNHDHDAHVDLPSFQQSTKPAASSLDNSAGEPALQRSKSLEHLPIHDWRVLCTGARIVRIPKDTVVVMQGSLNTRLFRIRYGSVRVEKSVTGKDSKKKTLKLAVLGKDQTFGEMSFAEDSLDEALVPQGMASATIVAEQDDTELYVIKRAFVFAIFRVDAGLFSRFYRTVAATLAKRAVNLPLQQKIHNLHHSSHEELSHAVGNEAPERSGSLPTLSFGTSSPEAIRRGSPQTPKSAVASGIDNAFRRKFKGIPDDEVLVKELNVVITQLTSSRSTKRQSSKQLKQYARLWLGNTRMVLQIKLFGHKDTRLIPYVDVLSVETTPPATVIGGDESDEDLTPKRSDSSSSFEESMANKISLSFESENQTSVVRFQILRDTAPHRQGSLAAIDVSSQDADAELLQRLVAGAKKSLSGVEEPKLVKSGSGALLLGATPPSNSTMRTMMADMKSIGVEKASSRQHRRKSRQISRSDSKHSKRDGNKSHRRPTRVKSATDLNSELAKMDRKSSRSRGKPPVRRLTYDDEDLNTRSNSGSKSPTGKSGKRSTRAGRRSPVDGNKAHDSGIGEQPPPFGRGSSKITLRAARSTSGSEFLRMSFDDATRMNMSDAQLEAERQERAVERKYAVELSLTQGDWTAILASAECTTYKMGQVIVQQGAPNDCLYQVASGTVRLEQMQVDDCKSTQGPELRPIGIMKTRDMFGEVGFIEAGTGAYATVTAASEHCAIYKISRASLGQLSESQPFLAGKMFKFLALRLSRQVRQQELLQERALLKEEHIHGHEQESGSI